MTENIDLLSFEEILSKLNFIKLELITHGNGWVGSRRYKITTSNYGSAESDSIDGLRKMIISKWGFMLR